MPPDILSLPDFAWRVCIEQEILGCSYPECDWTPLVEYQRTGVLPKWAVDKMKTKENK